MKLTCWTPYGVSQPLSDAFDAWRPALTLVRAQRDGFNDPLGK
jgi:hypothetical protein